MVTLKIISALSGLLGSLILAYRVIGLIKALALVVKVHEENINQLMNDDGVSPLVNFHSSTKHVEKAQKTHLLVLGFFLVILSAIIQLITLIL